MIHAKGPIIRGSRADVEKQKSKGSPWLSGFLKRIRRWRGGWGPHSRNRFACWSPWGTVSLFRRGRWLPSTTPTGYYASRAEIVESARRGFPGRFDSENVATHAGM